MSRRQQHDIRFVELNSLLSHGEPTPGSLKRMKELYHTISARHLSPPNVGKFMSVADYLKRRDAGMDHARAYQTSILFEKEKEMMNYHGTKGAKRAIRTRLQDRVMVPKMEEMLKEQLAVAESAGIPKELFHTIMNETLRGMGFRSEFNKSLLKAGFITELPPSGGGAGSGPGILADTPEFDAHVESSVMKSLGLLEPRLQSK